MDVVKGNIGILLVESRKTVERLVKGLKNKVII